MKLYTRFIKIKRTVTFGLLAVIPIIFALVTGVSTLKPQVQAMSLSDDVLEFYSLNDIMFYDPSCIVSGDSTLCGDTAEEIYWTAWSKYFDEVHAAAIMGNMQFESNFSPVLCEEGHNCSWEHLYNDCYGGGGCATGVGAIQLTTGLSEYLHYVNEKYPDLVGYFKDRGYTTLYGDAAMEKIGKDDFMRLVEMEVEYIYGTFSTDGIFSLSRFESMSTPEEAGAYFMTGYERCNQAYSSCSASRRGAAAKEFYDEYAGFTCVGGGSSSGAPSLSGVIDSTITLIGDSIAVNAKAELEAEFGGSFFTMAESRSADSGGVCAQSGQAILSQLLSGSGTIETQQTAGGSCVSITLDDDSLKDNIVWELGTNVGGVLDWGTRRVTRSVIDSVVSSIGNRKLFLVTPYNGGGIVYDGTNVTDITDSVAEMYRKVAEENDNVYIVDWNEAVRGNVGTYLSDGIHPTAEGRKLLAELIKEAVEESQNCVIDSNSTGYQERLKNLYKFNQGSGTWASEQMCNGHGNKISRSGCGVMSLYAAYYMFTGNNLDDKSFYTNLITVTEQDGYNSCSGTSESGYGTRSEELTGIKMEKLWGCSSDDCYKDEYWNTIVEELKKGHKIILGTAGPNSPGGRSIFAQKYHASFLDHYDESTGMVYRFDPIYNRCSYEGIICDSDDYRNGHYVTREAMERYVRPYSGWAMIYKDDSCYNICEVGGTETTPIYPLFEDSVDVPCAQGTEEIGIYDHALHYGQTIKVRLCKVTNLRSTGQLDNGDYVVKLTDRNYYGEGYAIVNSRVSGAFYALAARAQSQGVGLYATSSFRTYEYQNDLYNYFCGVGQCGRAAAAGRSWHEVGLAVDFNTGPSCDYGTSASECDRKGDSISLWLRDNIGDFGFERPEGPNAGSLNWESWHVQPLPESEGGG